MTLTATVVDIENGTYFQIDILRRLQQKSPSTSIIKSTKIGKIVSRLADGSKTLLDTTEKDLKVHKQLVKEAKLLKEKWTEVIERRVELKEEGSKIDVKLDAISTSFRNKAVTLMLEAVNSNCDNDKSNNSGPNSEINAPDEDFRSKLLESTIPIVIINVATITATIILLHMYYIGYLHKIM